MKIINVCNVSLLSIDKAAVERQIASYCYCTNFSSASQVQFCQSISSTLMISLFQVGLIISYQDRLVQSLVSLSTVRVMLESWELTH